MALERLAPLGDEGGELTRPDPQKVPRERVSRERVSKERVSKPRPAKAWPTREEREAHAEAKAQARTDEIAADPTGFARQVCRQLLEIGPRSHAELARALATKGVPEQAAEQVLARFAEVGIIDDALFASLWVSSRHRGRGLAARALIQELRRKGIDDELVREAVGVLGPDQEAATARELVRRKLPSSIGLTTDARVRRLVGMLARKGYGAGLAFRIVKEELEREGADIQALNLDTDGRSAFE